MDLNADLAESFGRWELGDDEALLRIVTSANVACGFHAGDPGVIRRACAWAAREGVTIGAQVGYRDLLGFGRRFVDIAPAELTDEVLYQIGALEALAGAEGAEVSYVKPHGALYNAIVSHREQASAVVEAVHSHGRDLAALGLPGSLWLRLAEERGLRTFREAFADRAYTPEGTLVPRGEPNAVLTDPDAVATRCLRLARGEPIEAVDGSELEVAAESICLHGDTPEAVAIARAVRDRLVSAGITPTPMSRR